MSEFCFILVGFTALVGACLVLGRARNHQDVKIPIFPTIGVCTVILEFLQTVTTSKGSVQMRLRM